MPIRKYALPYDVFPKGSNGYLRSKSKVSLNESNGWYLISNSIQENSYLMLSQGLQVTLTGYCLLTMDPRSKYKVSLNESNRWYFISLQQKVIC